MEHWTCNRGLSHYSVNFSSASIHFEGSKIPSVLCIVRTRRALKTPAAQHAKKSSTHNKLWQISFESLKGCCCMTGTMCCAHVAWECNWKVELNFYDTKNMFEAINQLPRMEGKIVINLYSDSVTGNRVEIVALGSFFGCAKKGACEAYREALFQFRLGILNFPHISRARSSFQGFIGAPRRLLRSNVYSVRAL